jgi:Ca-activated chloride channel family protein
MWIRHSSQTLSTALVLCLLVTTSDAQQNGAATPVPTSGRPIFRTAVELVALNVTVLDERHRFVSGLGPEAFVVFENGVRQELAFFGRADVPFDLALLLDVSGSMTQTMELLRKSAIGFLRTLRPRDRAAVVGFAHRMQVLQPLTRDITQLETAIQQARPHGDTALYDAVYITLRELERERKASPDVRRQAIVLLSDGNDTASMISGDDALAAAQRSGVTIYTVALKRPARSKEVAVVNRATAEAEFTLKALAQDSGGRIFAAEGAAQLAGIYDAIASEMAHQYVLGYVPQNPASDRTFRHVNVRVGSPGPAQVRTRRGYYAADHD